VLLVDEKIRFADVGAQVCVSPRTIHVGKTPRRMYYDAKMQRIVVACTDLQKYVIRGRVSDLGG
jgi:hypothetical protein